MLSRKSGQIAVIGIDIGKNFSHVVGLDKRGAIVLRQKWSRGQVEARLANMPPCLAKAFEGHARPIDDDEPSLSFQVLQLGADTYSVALARITQASLDERHVLVPVIRVIEACCVLNDSRPAKI